MSSGRCIGCLDEIKRTLMFNKNPNLLCEKCRVHVIDSQNRVEEEKKDEDERPPQTLTRYVRNCNHYCKKCDKKIDDPGWKAHQ